MRTLEIIILLVILNSNLAKTQYVDFLINTTCTNRANEKGVCKFFEDCPHIVNNKNTTEVLQCNEQGIICCIPEVQVNTTTQSSDTDFDFLLASELNEERISERKCKEYSKSTKGQITVAAFQPNQQPNVWSTDKCYHNSVSLVVGGKAAHRFEFPHQALLGYMRGFSFNWVCGGSLVSPRFILTAAHCGFHKVADESGKSIIFSIKNVKLGMIDLTRNDSDTKTYTIRRFISHPDFNSFTKNSDIAIISLTMNVQLNEKIHPICLPTKEYERTNALVTGFGRTDSRNIMSERLMKAILEKYNDTYCEDFYPGLFDSTKMMCFGNSNSSDVIDSCNGDSGGPLQIYHENVSCSYTQIGIVSFGNEDCNEQGSPGFYVNVFHFIDWIEKIVWPNE